jgi:hypothetical protein
MTPLQASYLSWLRARHEEATRALRVAYPATMDAAADRWRTANTELIALRREIQATERAERATR